MNNLLLIQLLSCIIFLTNCEKEEPISLIPCTDEFAYGSVVSTYECASHPQDRPTYCTEVNCLFSSLVFYVSSEYKTGLPAKWMGIELEIQSYDFEFPKVLYPDNPPACDRSTGTFVYRFANSSPVPYKVTMFFEDETYKVYRDTLQPDPELACISINLTD